MFFNKPGVCHPKLSVQHFFVTHASPLSLLIYFLFSPRRGDVPASRHSSPFPSWKRECSSGGPRDSGPVQLVSNSVCTTSRGSSPRNPGILHIPARILVPGQLARLTMIPAVPSGPGSLSMNLRHSSSGNPHWRLLSAVL